MARIVYAASGDGLGHATRAHSVGAGLLERGHDVRFVSCLRGSRYLLEQFPGCVEDIFGFELTYQNGQTQPLRSMLNLARRAVRGTPAALEQVDRFFRAFCPDLLITDAEAVTPRVAWWRGIRFISLDNLHLLTHCRMERPPGFWSDDLGARGFIRLIHGGARRYLITTFIEATVRHQPTTLLPPVLRDRVYHLHPTEGDYLTAYFGAAGGGEAVPALVGYDRMPIRAYGCGRVGVEGAVTFRPTSVEGFLDDLSGCAGVIASAGHSIISECLFLRKPMLLAPIGRQFEQRLNAFHVRRLGAGDYVERLTTEAIHQFNDRLGGYRQALARYPRTSLSPILDAVESELP